MLISDPIVSSSVVFAGVVETDMQAEAAAASAEMASLLQPMMVSTATHRILHQVSRRLMWFSKPR